MSLGKQQLSDYQVCHVIGSGSFGTCYKVRQKYSNKFYVWKVIDYGEMSDEKKKLLVSEVNVLSELESEHIVRYHDRIIDPYITALYIIMEYCPGGDLATLIKKCKRTEQYLDEKFIWKVLYQLSMALQVCHSRREHYQVLHRDIKPANVFLDEQNNVKLGDFGLARVLTWDESHSNTLVGTPYYMSPEVINGGKYNLKSDIWALGCLIYELCSFRPPFHGDNIQELSEQIMEKRFSRIPAHYSDDLNTILIYMLSKNNEVRPNIEALLQHPLVLKYTASYQNTLDKVRPDVVNTQVTISYAPTCKELDETSTSKQENDVKASTLPVENVQDSKNPSDVSINTHVRHSKTKDSKSTNDINKTEITSDAYDEIYGTCIDIDTLPRKTLGKPNRENNQRELHECNEVQDETSAKNIVDERPTEGTKNSVETNVDSNGESSSRELSEEENEICSDVREKKENEKLSRDQMSLIRQIFNSKMHIYNIMQCCSSEENIYMTSKSLLGKNLKDSNNNRPEDVKHVADNVSSEMDARQILFRKNSKEKRQVRTEKSYLETAIDGSLDNGEQQSKEREKFVARSDAERKSREVSLDAIQDPLMARYQTLEDKINEILAIQLSRNQKTKSDNGEDLDIVSKEKLDKIRQHEAFIKNKEKQLQAFELNLMKREKSLALQEKMVQEKIQRAEVYLKQCRDSRRTFGRSVTDSDLKTAKDHFKLNTGASAEQMDKPVRNANNGKFSKTSLPIRRSKDTAELKRLSQIDNDSSFSADPGDTSILPTMCKLDPDKVKPMKYYRHVRFEDQVIELFNDIDEARLNKNEIPETNEHVHITQESPKSSEDKQNMPNVNRYLKPLPVELNRQGISTRQTEPIMTRKLSDTNSQMNLLDRKHKINLHPNTSNINNAIPYRTKPLCQTFQHQRHSLSNMKHHQNSEDGKPLSNILTNNIIKHARSNGLVGPGFITSTLNTKVSHEPIKTARKSSLLPLGVLNLQSRHDDRGDDQDNDLTGMRKHFVKSKQSHASNSSVQKWIRQSTRSRETGRSHNTKPNIDYAEGDKENVGTTFELNHRRLSSIQNENMKQLNSDNLAIVRKHLQPLSTENPNVLQNYAPKSGNNFRDILKTRYDDLELSPVPSELFRLDLKNS